LKLTIEAPFIRRRIQEGVGLIKRPKEPRVSNVKPNEIDKVELKLKTVNACAIRLFSCMNGGIAILTKVFQKLSMECAFIEQERASLNDLVVVSLTRSGQRFQSAPQTKEGGIGVALVKCAYEPD
jgi:hypothetical protein